MFLSYYWIFFLFIFVFKLQLKLELNTNYFLDFARFDIMAKIMYKF